MNTIQYISKPLTWFVAASLAISVAGCGGGTADSATSANLASIAVTPATATVATAATQQFVATATYNDGTPAAVVTASTSWTSATPGVATINSTSGLATGVAAGTSVITGSFGGKTATATLTVTASTVLPGVAGTLGANATNPTVISANPRNLGANVPTSSNSWSGAANVVSGTLVAATFNAAMDPATITAVGTFTLKQTIAGTNVPGAVSMNSANTIATFTPTAAALVANTSYTATMSTAAQRASDNLAMPKAVVWSFTTNAAVLTGQTPVDLLTTSDFAVLANTAAVTYNGVAAASAVTGDVGMVTLSSASFAGFSTYAVNATNDYATAAEVVVPGKLYASDYSGDASPGSGLTPAKMILAGTDMTLAYNDAAGRTPAAAPPFLEAGTGSLDGLTLAPGVYTWAGNVTSSTAVTISGGPDDVWIFQIGGFFRPGNNTNMTLSNPTGGAPPQAKNIFWAVAGADATLGTTAHLEGVILTGTGFITLNSGATVNGRLLAHTAITVGGTVTRPAQ